MADVLLPLALMYVNNNAEIEGATRFQKLAFLTQKEKDISELHEFKSDKYGPFSPSLAGSIKTLENKGIIERRTETTVSGNEKYIYSLTDEGRRVVKSLINDENRDVDHVLKAAESIKKRYQDTPLDRLLRYVYQKYPDYTEKSELDIVDKI
ncbi:PadR family transcriptional regulator [Halogeometricum borinquense]|nr:winged helix-turn-helix transcriptional regulator [Halogeometricum borinquense]ELY31092.1 transcriptional regulator padr-like family protein [Halogeometricum borinquense DSM 11551]QIQ75735.1 PadR family transcriptional regulator [Halogeometricum borinquense]